MELPSPNPLAQCTDQNPLSTATTEPQNNPSTILQKASSTSIDDAATDVLERKPKPESVESSHDSDTPDYTEKYNKYEADYVRRLKAKYFSRKDLYGGVIFDKEDTIDGEIIKSSRFPPTWSFTDPVHSFEDQNRFSASAAETSTNNPNRKPQCKKNS